MLYVERGSEEISPKHRQIYALLLQSSFKSQIDPGQRNYTAGGTVLLNRTRAWRTKNIEIRKCSTAITFSRSTKLLCLIHLHAALILRAFPQMFHCTHVSKMIIIKWEHDPPKRGWLSRTTHRRLCGLVPKSWDEMLSAHLDIVALFMNWWLSKVESSKKAQGARRTEQTEPGP